MQRVIHKAKLKLGSTEIKVPKGAVLLTVQEQDDNFIVWYDCDPDAPLESRYTLGVGTGHPIHSSWKLRYLSTVQQGIFVWHFFEVL